MEDSKEYREAVELQGAIAQLGLQLEQIGAILSNMAPKYLEVFKKDLQSVDEVEDALMEPFGAESRKKMRVLTAKQVGLILELKKVMDLIHEAKAENAAAMKSRAETQEKIKKGEL